MGEDNEPFTLAYSCTLPQQVASERESAGRTRDADDVDLDAAWSPASLPDAPLGRRDADHIEEGDR